MKNISFTILLSLITINFNAQSQVTVKYDKTIGGGKNDYFTCMAATKDEGLIMAGESSSNASGDKTANAYNAYTDFWVVKLDSSGSIEWDKTIGGANFDVPYAIEQCADGSYVVAGTSYSGRTFDKTGVNRGAGDFWMIKLDAYGNIEWDKTIGGDSNDFLVSIHQTKDRGFVLAGSSSSGIYGEKHENSKGDFDYWIIKLNCNGGYEWDKTIGGSEADYLGDMQLTDDGGYILGGKSQSDNSGDKTEDNVSYFVYDYWVVKLNSQGNIEWDNTIGGNSIDELRSLKETKDGGYILGGFSSSYISGDKSEASRSGSPDYWIVKLDKTGTVVKDKTIGSDLLDDLYGLVECKEGGYLVGGTTYSEQASGDKTENGFGGLDYWIVKLNEDLSIAWDKTIGGDNDDFFTYLIQPAINKYVLGGYSYSPVSGYKTQHRRGGYDYWLVGVEETVLNIANHSAVSFESVVSNKKDVLVYPNPVKNTLHIQTTGKATFTLINQSGKIILTKTINGNGEMNVAPLPVGLYYLKNNETGAIRKIMITK